MRGPLLRCVLLTCALLPLPSLAVTTHAVIVVMDGARYTETMGDQTHANVPHIAALAAQGVVLSAFRTASTGSVAESWTGTNPGHARITTGTYQNIANDGSMLPSQPGIFQQYRQQTSAPATSAWVICSKDKLFILGNSSAVGWNNQYQPSMSCGINGDGSGGYREDNATHAIVLQKLTTDRPALMIVNYKGPDAMGHANNWAGYLLAIQEVDGYVNDIWNTIQADPVLQNTTALFIVNDHGRHTTDFTSHGDNCAGCRNIMCVAIGPDIRTNVTSSTTREQIDLAPTIASMMGFALTTATGQVMTEILRPTAIKRGRNRTVRRATPGRTSVTVKSNRSVVFSDLPAGTVVDIMSLSGAHVARLAADRMPPVWNAASSRGASAATGYFVCKIGSASSSAVQMHSVAERAQ